jgi:membrane associated rhomboid family serine protease
MRPTARAIPWPLATLALVAALVGAYAIDANGRVETGLGPTELPARWVFDGAAPRPWQFVSYAFVHWNLRHLSLNALVLLLALALVERRIGAARTIVTFFALTAAVALGFHAIDARDLFGASGAAAAMVTMSAALWAAAPAQRAAIRAAVCVCAALFFLWTEGLPWLSGRPNPGAKPHAIGALSGALTGVAFALNQRREARSASAEAPT